MAFATVSRCGYDERSVRGHRDNAVGFDHSIENKSGARFALAPGTVAAVRHKGMGEHFVSNMIAHATAFDGECRLRGHGGSEEKKVVEGGPWDIIVVLLLLCVTGA